MKRICVFCGSSHGSNPAYTQAARSLGTLLADEKIGVVYGGGNIGLMKELADAALEHGGKVIGVIPRALMDRELGHAGLTELKIVDSMHTRKQTMSDLADAFIALPGGLGTLEELFEIATWAQLGIHTKPCGLLNVEGFYDNMRTFLNHMLNEKFIRPEHLDLIMVDDSPQPLLSRLRKYKPHHLKKWIDQSKT